MDDADDDFDWLSFYRQQFEDVVNEESMKRIADEYKGSEKEKSDLLAAYTKYKGRFAYIYEAVMLSDILEDDDRFRTIINQAIELGTVESYAAWERENNDEKRQKAKDAERKRKADWDKRQAEKEAQADADATAGASTSKPKAKGRAKKSAGGDMADLQALISQRQRARQGGNFFERLEAKYAQPSGGRGSKRATPMDEGPSDEAFVAMGERKKARTSARGKKSKDVDVDEDMGEDEDIVGSEEISEEDAPKKKRAKKPRKGRGRAKA
jgi:DnaJ family protein C protein 9